MRIGYPNKTLVEETAEFVNSKKNTFPTVMHSVYAGTHIIQDIIHTDSAHKFLGRSSGQANLKDYSERQRMIVKYRIARVVWSIDIEW